MGAAAVLIAVAPFFETWLQGVLVRMSLGFTLFLPPLVYALAAFAYIWHRWVRRQPWPQRWL